MKKIEIIIQDQVDRENVIIALANNGYAVTSNSKWNGTEMFYYVEFEIDDNEAIK